MKIKINDKEYDADTEVVTHIQTLEERISQLNTDNIKGFKDRIALLKIDDSIDLSKDLIELKKDVLVKRGVKIDDGVDERFLDGAISMLGQTATKSFNSNSGDNGTAINWDELKTACNMGSK